MRLIILALSLVMLTGCGSLSIRVKTEHNVEPKYHTVSYLNKNINGELEYKVNF